MLLPFMPQADAEVSLSLARIGFLVLGLATCAHAVWASLRKEPMWGLVLAFGGLTIEAMALLGLAWINS